ncbi:MAG: hypothetical protein AAF571_07470 [Verrucomicrobiota bacterium]
MSSRLQFTAVLVCTALWFSCSPPAEESSPDPSIPKKVSSLEPRTAEPEPEPIPQLVILFEFEGIPQSTLNAWIGDRNLKLIQRQLELDTAGLPIEPADLYILSPRLITQFIEKGQVTHWNPQPNLSNINPTFTSHNFDFQNLYAIPWRWTPMVLLEHVTDTESSRINPQSDSPNFPDDPIMIASLQSLPAAPGPIAPTVPNPAAYRIAWETFLESPATSVWIPAACPIRNTSDYVNPGWKWIIPSSGTTIVFDHLLLGSESELKQETYELLEYLLSANEQNFLLTTSGYLPVICPLGKETHTSPIPMPAGDWLNNSGFISLPAYTLPAPAEAEPATPETEIVDSSEVDIESTNDAPAPPSSPTPAATHPDQTVY